MNSDWIQVSKVTGKVGVVAFLFSRLMKYLFQEEIVSLFGDTRFFYIVMTLMGIFGVAIVLAIVKPSRTEGSAAKVVYKGESQHRGDNKF